MASQQRSRPAEPGEALDLLSRTLPFSELSPEERAALAADCRVEKASKGARIMTQGETEITALLIIRAGGVKLFLTSGQGEERLVDYRGEGSYVGALGLIRGSRANLNVEAVEDAEFLAVPRAAFLDLLRTNPAFTGHFLRTFTEAYVSKAFAELRHRQADICASESPLYLFATTLGDVAKGDPRTASRAASIRECAALMAEHGIGSLLITGEGEAEGGVEGIITDKDLRRVVARGQDFDAPVEAIMSSPVVTMEHHAVCFDALIRMMDRKIHHLAVTRGGVVSGMVTSHDIMVLQGRSPVALFREILAQRAIPGLYDLSRKIPLVAGRLLEEGAKAGNITRMISVLNDLILDKLLTMLQDEMGPPPVPFCWLLMGSEGRKEQTFRTDQDNALVYQDPRSPGEARACEDYFAAFTRAAIDHLVACGYPLCPGEMMAVNPKWRKPYAEFREFFESLIMRPEPQEVLHASIFFDFRPGYGRLEFGEALRDHVAVHAKREHVFQRHLAADCMKVRPPLSLFRSFVVEKDGEHKNTLNIKERGLTPFVDFARLFALRHGVKETNTLDRLRLLREGGHLSGDLLAEAAGAYEFLMQLRLVLQMGQIRRGQQPNNQLDPGTLSEMEKRTLKDAFGVIGRLQGLVRDAFRLSLG
ncbi:MAG: putative nucleotidyltransferase substrate binding domain-containing protein [Thermodesulfobacteriota bacterium]